ncbi:FAD-dependent oxidoreductase [Pseudanabaena sp. FACHB-1998]|uniref:FAD-dependent oxidoreductase n=1 Tax=Pseudanabaena sp. FACHB-1998 TaxID=2692858 RepID=UPI001681524B|nr:FAD-dependent oxidoreductase [Pseudanabaena sp. FACHB-1998]MBD2178472.1 FAD-dependent oxidoreductase [Pseudanabaena sp. FACHB-1998]
MKPYKYLSPAIALGIVAIANGVTDQAIAQTSTPKDLSKNPDRVEGCEILIVGGGVAGTASAYEGLLAGRTVCMTEITDWVGGQLTSQGTSALDEAKKQRNLWFFPQGYTGFRKRIEQKYGKLNAGDCWVSVSCFMPNTAQQILTEMLQEAERKGNGKLKWFPNTIIKKLDLSSDGKLINRAIAIQHRPAPNTAPLNTEPLSTIIDEAYRYENSPRLQKEIIQFVPLSVPLDGQAQKRPTDWFVIDATETGEIIALADVPYRLGLDPRSHLNPSSPVTENDAYCTQGFTYTFAMEQTAEPQPQQKPSFYDRYLPYYGSDPKPNLANFDNIFTYRRIWSAEAPNPKKNAFGVSSMKTGDISMQNWVWGNDYRGGTDKDNLIYSREQLQRSGQLEANGWMGGLRQETLKNGEEIALGFYYWLVAGTTDSQQKTNWKKPFPNHRLLQGIDSPMGTMHGLSKYPYIRESRRIIGRPSYGYPEGFSMSEIDVSQVDFSTEFYRQNLSPQSYRHLWNALAGLEATSAIRNNTEPQKIPRRTRSTIYPDAIGIAQYYLDFHPCLSEYPVEKAGNTERAGVRNGHGAAFPGQIPLRSLIPQKIDNLIVSGKNIAYSYIVAAGYRVHSYEWSVGAAAGTTASFALSEGILPYQLVESLPRVNPLLTKLQQTLVQNNNAIAFPDTSIFNLNWGDWKIW